MYLHLNAENYTETKWIYNIDLKNINLVKYILRIVHNLLGIFLCGKSQLTYLLYKWACQTTDKKDN